MAGAGERKGKKDDNGIGTAIDFVLSNARLVLGVGKGLRVCTSGN